MTDNKERAELPYIIGAPERIVLCVHDEVPEGTAFTDLEEVTWCEDWQHENDIEYVRADLAASQEKAEACPVCANGSLAPMSEDVAGRQFQFSVCDGCGSEVTNAEQSRANANAAPIAAQASEPVATLHGDGHWTWKKPRHDHDPAFWKMDVFAAPVAAQASEPVARVDYSARGNIAWLFGPQLPDGTELYPAPQPSAAVVRDAALEEAAKWVDKRRGDFDAENGHTDPDTGAFEYGRGAHAAAKGEYSGELAEIADAIRALKSAPPQPAEDCYQHFLSYSGLAHTPMLQYAYFHGAGAAMDKPDEQPSARRVSKIHPDSALGKALREHSAKLYTPRTPESVNMDGRKFICGKPYDRGFISDENFDFDAGLTVSGDFGDPAVKDAYCQMICDVLNGASPVYDKSVVKRLATQMGWTPPSASPAALTLSDAAIVEAIREADGRGAVCLLRSDGSLTFVAQRLVAGILARAQGEQA